MFKKKILTLILILLFINCFLNSSYSTYVFAGEKKPLKTKTKKTATLLDKFTLNAQLELKYDTNVFNYSRDDIDEYDSYSNPNRFNQVKSIGDFIISPTFGIEFKDKLFEHTLNLGIEVEPHFYAHNKIKDYESYRFRLRQYLSKGEYLEFNYSHIPDFFVRNLYDRDYNEYRKGTFDKNLYILGYRRRLTQSLSTRIRYLYEQNDYNSDFNEYDLISNAINLSFWHELNDYFTSNLYFEFERADSKGDLDSTSRVEFNTSYDKYEIGLRETLAVTKRVDLYTQYIFSFRDYTTDNSISEDPYHADREDKIQRITFGLDYNFNKNARFFLRYEYNIKDVNTASEDPAVINASILGYEKHTVSCSISYKF